MTFSDIQRILLNITWKPSNVDMDWKWEVKKLISEPNFDEGTLIRTTFKRPDTHTGEIGVGYGRWMYVPPNVTEDGVVKTAWLCAELIVRHELMESFLFDGNKIFDPHKSIKDLSYKQCDTAKELL